MTDKPILVTGAAGQIGSVGFQIVKLLRSKGIKVRAMVRKLDDRSDALESLGAQVVTGDLTNLPDVLRVMNGCDRCYFGMSVSPSYLEATVNMAIAAEYYGINVLVNMSQMSVSQMRITIPTSSPQHKLHFLSEQVLKWSGLPVVTIRPTVFIDHPFFRQWAAESIKENGEIRLPFGTGKTSPIATQDVARVITEVLASPGGHIGKVYELTGLTSQTMDDICKEYSLALGITVKYVDVPEGVWESRLTGLPDHLRGHFKTMAALHKANQYDRLVGTVEQLTGNKPKSIREWVQDHASEFRK
jgi:uncharacterized protein YbjT (DUF2867 family)